MTIFNGGTVGAVDGFKDVAADAVVVAVDDAVVIVVDVADGVVVVVVVDEAIWDGTTAGEFLTACNIR